MLIPIKLGKNRSIRLIIDKLISMKFEGQKTCIIVNQQIIICLMTQGKILLPEVKIADKKYEGIEFVW